MDNINEAVARPADLHERSNGNVLPQTLTAVQRCRERKRRQNNQSMERLRNFNNRRFRLQDSAAIANNVDDVSGNDIVHNRMDENVDHSTNDTTLTTVRTITVPRRSSRLIQRNQSNVSRGTARAPLVNQAENPIINPLLVDCRQKWENKWRLSIDNFQKVFIENPFGSECSVCDRLWFKKDLTKVTTRHVQTIIDWYNRNNLVSATSIEEMQSQYVVCSTCRGSLSKGKMPRLAKENGFEYPNIPPNLPPLDPISERLISPRLPFMQIRRLRYDINYGVIGQVINVPVNVSEMITSLPRQLDEDYCINVNIKRNILHKSTYLTGYVKKRTIRAWLNVLQDSTLYKLYDIKVDLNLLDLNIEQNNYENNHSDGPIIEQIHEEINPDSELLAARQHTMIWNEDQCLDIAPGQRALPLNIIFDKYAEELAFPSIYLGEPRKYRMEINVTPYMIANSEIRRRDRRGVTPYKILYMAMKILRLRTVDGIYNTFRTVNCTENVTRRMLENKQSLEECLEKNLAFFKTVPNSVQYWYQRKKDLFAMIRQLGKPTVFLTLSANEIRWPELLNLLNKLSGKFHNIDVNLLSRSQRCTLVSEDPITCCIYFYKIVQCLTTMLKSARNFNPFGRYKVEDYFVRYEFQHRGSPHAHILLWLQNDPKESVSEQMPGTIALIESLCSVDVEDVPTESIYANQVHKHTFTCFKRGEENCRFGIPYWPMESTIVLLPLSQSDNRRNILQTKAKRARINLEHRTFTTLSEFLIENQLTPETYLDMMRSTLRRPMLFFNRNMKQIITNTFHPWIAGVLNSNTDLQIVLDEFSCAAYVVEYVNKAARGMGNLHNELIKLMQEQPDRDYTGQLKSLGLKLLNSVEMSAQEAAWYLLRQPMSVSSRNIAYIPTVWPSERSKSRKQRQQMDRENLHPESTDVWTKNIIQRYEERPLDLDSLYLAEFVAWYALQRDLPDENEFEEADNELDIGVNMDTYTSTNRTYRKRLQARVIRYRSYELDDVVNYKREAVLLFFPFRNELVEILDRNKFIDIYDANEDLLLRRRSIYQAKIDINKIMAEIMALCVLDENNQDNIAGAEGIEPREDFVRNVLGDSAAENVDDIDTIDARVGISAVRKRSNVIPKQQYCEIMRNTNAEQRELILEAIHRMHNRDEPLQVFFTGPAGSGKSFTLKLLMETYNRFGQQHNSLRNSYVSCASTGKAAVAIGGTTVHSAFRLSLSRRTSSLPTEVLSGYRNMFVGVKCIIIDEISMLSSSVLHKTNERLQQITAVYDKPFGGLDVYLCGDFRQLPPVRAAACYTMPPNQLGGPALWHCLNYFPLKRVVRQSDECFSTILTKIGNGDLLTDNEAKLIESRHRLMEWCNENEPEAVRLFYCNRDVDEYNRNVIKNALDWNATDVILGYATISEKNECRGKLHRFTVAECDGAPFTIPLAVGYSYMISANIDVADGLVNGLIGILRHIEEVALENITNDRENISSSSSEENSRNHSTDRDFILWFDFYPDTVGAHAKIKYRPHVLSKPGLLSLSWVPLRQRVVNIRLSRTVKCKRKQFPIVPACAITIHKSQGGTFNKIVFKYSPQQPQQLVYVALSRVTTIEGLFIITENDSTFRFGHGRRICDAPAIREIRDEYRRLERHLLPTIFKEVEAFITSTKPPEILILNFNVQSLRAHSGDIESDPLLKQCHVFALTETWLRNNEEPIPITNFECVARVNNRSTSSNSSAGGTAIYRSISSSLFGKRIDFSIESRATHVHTFGDVCLAEIVLPIHGSDFKFVLASVYVHPGTSIQNVNLLLFESLLPFIHKQQYIPPMITVDSDIPVLLCGDFNLNILADQSKLLFFLKDTFNLDLISDKEQATTLNNTCLDLTFARYLNVNIIRYISYFSYHRPLINRVNIMQ